MNLIEERSVIHLLWMLSTSMTWYHPMQEMVDILYMSPVRMKATNEIILTIAAWLPPMGLL